MLLFIISLIIVAIPVKAEVTYEYWWGGLEKDEARGIAIYFNGDIIVVGNTYSFGVGTPTYSNVFVARIDGDTGQYLWSIWFGGPYNEYAIDVAVDLEGNVYVVGVTGSYKVTIPDAFIVKINSSGYPEWAYHWGFAATAYDNKAIGVAVDKQNNVYVVGSGYSGTYWYDALGLSFTSDGSLRWSRIYRTSVAEELADVIVAPDGSALYVVGHRYYAGSDYHIVLAGISPNDGRITWQRYVGAVAMAGRRLVADTNGNLYVIGSTKYQSHGLHDIILFKYNTKTNRVEWFKIIGGSGKDGAGYPDHFYPWGIAILGGDGIYITAYTESIGQGLEDFYIAKYTFNGEKVWSKTWGTTGSDVPGGIALLAGKVLVTGLANATTGVLADLSLNETYYTPAVGSEGLSTVDGLTPYAITLTQGTNWDFIPTANLDPTAPTAILISLDLNGNPVSVTYYVVGGILEDINSNLLSVRNNMGVALLPILLVLIALSLLLIRRTIPTS